jgi:hypothetical protein
MTSLVEFNARAALCRQFAKLEPGSKELWLAEAERWSRLKREPGVEGVPSDDGPAEIWCWKAIRKRRRTEVQFEFGNGARAADEDRVEGLARGLSVEAPYHIEFHAAGRASRPHRSSTFETK